jgi:hypothetical protein
MVWATVERTSTSWASDAHYSREMKQLVWGLGKRLVPSLIGELSQ